MRADYPVLIDSCVLAEAATSDLLLRLGEEPRLFLPRWTESIWAETKRTFVQRLGWPEDIADGRIAAAKEFFPEAMVSGFEHLIEICKNHPDDRHVLAAAIHSKTEAIVTFNVKDFKTEALEPWSIRAAHPEAFLKLLFDHDADTVTNALQAMAERAKRTVPEMLGRLSWYVDEFAAYAAAKLSMDLPTIGPQEWRR